MVVDLARLQSLPEGLFARCARDPDRTIALQRQGNGSAGIAGAACKEALRQTLEAGEVDDHVSAWPSRRASDCV